MGFIAIYHKCGMRMTYQWYCGDEKIAVPLQRDFNHTASSGGASAIQVNLIALMDIDLGRDSAMLKQV